MSRRRNLIGLQAKTIGTLGILLVVLVSALVLLNLSDLKARSAAELKISSALLADSFYNGIVHPMSVNDTESIRRQISAYADNTKHLQVLVFGFDRRITYASEQSMVGADMKTLFPSPSIQGALTKLLTGETRRSEGSFDTQDDSRFMTTFKSMRNEKQCHHCHGKSQSVLGGLMVRRNVDREDALQAEMRRKNIWIAGVGILVSVSLVYVLIRMLVIRPVGRLVGVAHTLARGDLTGQINLRQKDELGQLAASINEVASSLNTVIWGVDRRAEALADGSGQQAAAVEETAASIEEIASMFRKAAENSQSAQALVDETRRTMKEARESMRTLSGYIAETSSASDDVAKIVKSIEEIAFQTNLLALNAAVEAARAGEQGAGFAVVADEVRRLAQRAAQAAEQTAERIQNIVGKIKQSAQLVDTTDDAYREVALKIKKVSTLSEEIAGASNEQANAIGQINATMATIDKVTQEQVSMARDLEVVMERFTVREDLSEPQPPRIDGVEPRPRRIDLSPQTTPDE